MTGQIINSTSNQNSNITPPLPEKEKNSEATARLIASINGKLNYRQSRPQSLQKTVQEDSPSLTSPLLSPLSASTIPKTTYKFPLSPVPPKLPIEDITSVVIVSPPLVCTPHREKLNLCNFVAEKAIKFQIHCTLLNTTDEPGASVYIRNSGTKSQIRINNLYLLKEEDIDFFLQQKPDHDKSIKKFLSEKKPELLTRAASDLIDWFNSNVKPYRRIKNCEDTKFLARQILLMHSIGRLADCKRFMLVHEMGHAYDRNKTESQSLGKFNPKRFDFIKPHQYKELRADLTAARILNAHEFGEIYFEWHSIIATQPLDSDSHPTDKYRALAIRLDYVDKLFNW